jgi:hypothetical protein
LEFGHDALGQVGGDAVEYVRVEAAGALLADPVGKTRVAAHQASKAGVAVALGKRRGGRPAEVIEGVVRGCHA